MSAFDPLDLDIDVTPARVFGCLEEEAWFDALLMALRLNEGANFFSRSYFFFWTCWCPHADAVLNGAPTHLNEASTLRAVYERLPAEEIKLLAQELPQVLY